jgi:hypothetical protein
MLCILDRSDLSDRANERRQRTAVRGKTMYREINYFDAREKPTTFIKEIITTDDLMGLSRQRSLIMGLMRWRL